MSDQEQTSRNVKEAVPFFGVSDMDTSLHFYVDGLGFEMKLKWVDEGKLRWCMLQIGDASIMLQEFWKDSHHTGQPEGKLGLGVSICFICDDAIAIYRSSRAHGIEAERPFVGNGMWVTSMADPDGYRIDFESYTDVPEETIYHDEVE